MTTIRRSGTASSSRPASSATWPASRSAPSSSSSLRGPAASALRSDSISGVPCWSWSWSRAARAVASVRGCRICSSATKTMSASVASRRRSASAASLLLPAPPGPMSVTSRDCRTRADNSASSRSRPTKLDRAAGSASPPVSVSASSPVSALASSSASAAADRAEIWVRPDSHRLTVANETPRRRASCSWLSPRRRRSSLSLSPTESVPLGPLTIEAYGLSAAPAGR